MVIAYHALLPSGIARRVLGRSVYHLRQKYATRKALMRSAFHDGREEKTEFDQARGEERAIGRSAAIEQQTADAELTAEHL